MAFQELRKFFGDVSRGAEIAADGVQSLTDDLKRWAPGRAPAKINKADGIEASIGANMETLLEQHKTRLLIEATAALAISSERGPDGKVDSQTLKLEPDEIEAIGLMTNYLVRPPKTCDYPAVVEAKKALFRTMISNRSLPVEIRDPIDPGVVRGMLYSAHELTGRSFVPAGKITLKQAKEIWRDNGLEGMPILGASPATGVDPDQLYQMMNMVKDYPGLERVLQSKALSLEKKEKLLKGLQEPKRRVR